MKNKKRRVILASIALLAMVAMTMPVFAAPGDRDLPGENEPFWTVFAQMSRPDDTATCNVAAASYVDSLNIPDGDQRNGELQGLTEMCTGIASMPSEMQSDLAAEGITSNIFAASDWHHVENLYFEKTGMGKIQFTNTIDFMSYRFMTFMKNFGEMVQFSDGYISLNASMMSDMKYYGTELTMLGLNFSEMPDIYVTDANGSTMHLATASDISGATYNAATGELTFNAAHFSAFRAVTKGSKVATMKISKVTPNKIKYNSRKSSFKITVKGKALSKKGADTTCTMGFQQAAKVTVSKNGKNVVCKFGMSSFSTLGTYPVTITVAGVGEVSKANAVRVR